MTLGILIPAHKELPLKVILVIQKGDKALILHFSDASEAIQSVWKELYTTLRKDLPGYFHGKKEFVRDKFWRSFIAPLHSLVFSVFVGFLFVCSAFVGWLRFF